MAKFIRTKTLHDMLIGITGLRCSDSAADVLAEHVEEYIEVLACKIKAVVQSDITSSKTIKARHVKAVLKAERFKV